MKSSFSIATATLTLVLLVSCLGRGGERQVFRGHYRDAFERSTFASCGSNEAWWVKGHLPRLVERAKAPVQDTRQAVRYVEVSGTLHGPGKFGHLGNYTHQLEVNEIIAVRQPRSTDCT